MNRRSLFFKVWKNTFLVEEFVEGIELAQWIAGNYPFSPNDDIQVYFNKIVKIMNQLKDIIYQMHNAGIAMCDLQTRNILVDETLNVTLIDFEIATDSDSERPTGMATKGYTHKLNKIASEKDWYSLNRILQFSLLPIGAVTDIDMNLNAVHCFWIRNNFGQTAYNYFIKYQTECCNHLSNKKEIFKETYSGCKGSKVLFEQDILNTIRNIFEKVTEGLLENCQIDRDSLINGDIRQFEMNCGKLNIFTGGYGAILALSRNNALPDNINTWIDNNMEDLCISNYNNGFLSGRSGIAATLYECGYIDKSLKLVNSIISDYSIETLDLSLRSGLSGIGLMLIAFYAETQTYKYKSEVIKIANNMMQKISSNEKLTMTDWDSVDVGLIDGYSGFALFYTLLYKISEEESYLQFAHELIMKDLEKSKVSDLDGSMQTVDIEKTRLLPYLANGSIGVGIAISVYNCISGQKDFQSELAAIIKVSEYRCCYDVGLLDGAGGFFILPTIGDEKKDEITSRALEKLQLFLLEKQNKIYIPGKWFFKVSSDMYSGSAGILLALQTLHHKNSLYWLPMLHKLLN